MSKGALWLCLSLLRSESVKRHLLAHCSCRSASDQPRRPRKYDRANGMDVHLDSDYLPLSEQPGTMFHEETNLKLEILQRLDRLRVLTPPNGV